MRINKNKNYYESTIFFSFYFKKHYFMGLLVFLEKRLKKLKAV